MKNLSFFLFSLLLLSGCIKDDFIDDLVDPVIRISNPIDSIQVNTDYQFETVYLNNIGLEEEVDVEWNSLDDSIIELDENGLATAKQIGTTIITAVYRDVDGVMVSDNISVAVGENPNTSMGLQSFEGTIRTTTFYVLEGDFDYLETETGVMIDIKSNYRASSSLPGLYIYLTNNPNSIANALEVSAVSVFSGAHNYTIPDVEFKEYSHILYYCKPFNVKVGDAALN